MTAVTASQARRDFFSLIREAAEGARPIEVVAKRGNVVIVSATEYASLVETAYLLSSPANAARLRESLAQARAGQVEARDIGSLCL